MAQNGHGETGNIPFSCTCSGLTVSALFFYARHTAGANSSEVWLCGADLDPPGADRRESVVVGA